MLILTGIPVIYRNGFELKEGFINANASTTGEDLLVYPADFNKDNCVVIAFGVMAMQAKGYNFCGHFKDSTSLFNNAYYRTISLEEQGIRVRIENPNSSQTKFFYKIVLMKI